MNPTAMLRLPLIQKTPFQVLGIPAYSTLEQIHSAYLRRLKVLSSYRYDKTKQPEQWAMVNEVVEELHQAYAQLLALGPARNASPAPASHAPLYEIAPISAAQNQPDEEPVSHREIAEKAVRAYQKLTVSADESEAQTKFIELIATRGFSESQHLPPLKARTAQSITDRDAAQPAPPAK